MLIIMTSKKKRFGGKMKNVFQRAIFGTLE